MRKIDRLELDVTAKKEKKELLDVDDGLFLIKSQFADIKIKGRQQLKVNSSYGVNIDISPMRNSGLPVNL
ncbi:hypothetical protein NC651_015970 [Populus alba x Populus x berolinensis]|nr:hypothetical protein NC651_015970 [Populus alba x Populus x berolinensis]